MSEREREGTHKLGMRITRERRQTRGRRGRKRRVKSGSPCAACGSKTRSSFLHLQVEYRDIRSSPHCRFSIPDFLSLLPVPRLVHYCFCPRVRPLGNRPRKGRWKLFYTAQRALYWLPEVKECCLKELYLWKSRRDHTFFILRYE